MDLKVHWQTGFRWRLTIAMGKTPVMDLKDHLRPFLRAAGSVEPTTIPAMELKNDGLSLHSLLIVERCSMSLLHARYSKKDAALLATRRYDGILQWSNKEEKA